MLWLWHFCLCRVIIFCFCYQSAITPKNNPVRAMAPFGSPSVPAGSSAPLRRAAARQRPVSAEPLAGFGLSLGSDGNGKVNPCCGPLAHAFTAPVNRRFNVATPFRRVGCVHAVCVPGGVSHGRVLTRRAFRSTVSGQKTRVKCTRCARPCFPSSAVAPLPFAARELTER
jgi:hypothetical protein